MSEKGIFIQADIKTLRLAVGQASQGKDREAKAKLLVKKEKDLVELLEAERHMLTLETFWRWVCKIKSLHGDDMANHLLQQLLNSATQDATPGGGGPGGGAGDLPPMVAEPEAQLDADEMVAVASLFDAVSVPYLVGLGEAPDEKKQVLYTAVLVLGHGGDREGALGGLEGKKDAFVLEGAFEEYWRGLKQKVGQGRMGMMLQHCGKQVDVLDRARAMHAEGDSSMLQTCFKVFFACTHGGDGEIKSPEELEAMLVQICGAFSLAGLSYSYDAKQLMTGQAETLAADEFAELALNTLRKHFCAKAGK